MADSLPSLDEIEDTHGVASGRFQLDWNDDGGFMPDLRSESFATIADTIWQMHRLFTSAQIWVLDWILGMDWLGYLLSPLAGIGAIVQAMIAQIGLLSLTLIILAAVVGFWLLKGRYAGGFMELVIGCVIAAAATGFLANPMATIGGDNGVIMSSRDAGMDIATGFATGGASFTADRETIRDGLQTQLTDALVRMPHQIINYGTTLDGGPCEDVYDESVGREGAAAAIGECAGEGAAETSAAATATTVVNTLALGSTTLVFLVLSVVIIGGTLFAVLLLGWSAIKLLWQLPVGVVSSGTRAQLFRTGASVGLGCILVAMATMFLVAWMQMMLGFYDATNGLPFLVRLYLFNTLVVAGAVFYVLMGSSVRAALRGLADRLATAGVPSQVGEPVRMPWAAENRAKVAEGVQRVKHWTGVGIGPKPAPAPETTPEASTSTANSTDAAKGQTMTNEPATERTEATTANPWTDAAQTAPVPAQSEGERLRERIATGAGDVARAGLQGVAAAGGPATATAVRGSLAVADGIQAMKDRRPDRARVAPPTVPEPYTSGRRAHVPTTNHGARRDDLIRKIRF